MNNTTGCREEILAAAKSIVKYKNKNEFSIKEVIEYMFKHNSTYTESTIRTHITSRCCRNAPVNHAIVYNDFERIARGKYMVINYR